VLHNTTYYLTKVADLTGFAIKASTFVEGKTFSNSDLFISDEREFNIRSYLLNSPRDLKAIHLWHANVSYHNVIVGSIISKILDRKNWIGKAIGVHSFKLVSASEV
jgi:hypothetical protein